MARVMTLPVTSSASVLPASPSGAPRRVLYVDDMKELRELLRIVLSRAGYVVETVPNGQVALDRIAAGAEPFDLIITDHHMPEMNGLELVRHLRSRGYGGLIVVFSSELSASVHREYDAWGVDRVLMKPIFPASLRKELSALFAERRPAD